MKKLIAQRPIQYMGRSYKRGDAIPAYDPKMVAAWRRAGSAEWDGETPAMLTGHLDAADLKKWKKEDLEKLAEEMGVDISKAGNNAERAAILAVVEVQAPADDEDAG